MTHMNISKINGEKQALGTMNDAPIEVNLFRRHMQPPPIIVVENE